MNHEPKPFTKRYFPIHLSVIVGTGRDLSCLHHHSLFVLFKNLHFKPFENKIFDTIQSRSVTYITIQGLVNLGIFVWSGRDLFATDLYDAGRTSRDLSLQRSIRKYLY